MHIVLYVQSTEVRRQCGIVEKKQCVLVMAKVDCNSLHPLTAQLVQSPKQAPQLPALPHVSQSARREEWLEIDLFILCMWSAKA